MKSLGEALRTGAIALRNVVWGGNLASLRFLRHPRSLVGYASETLFLARSFDDARALPQRSVLEVLPSKAAVPVVLAETVDKSWWQPVTSYLADLVGLCLLCRVLRPQLVFEIGTLRGYTAYHFALNSPESARILTLDLPRDHAGGMALATTLMDDAHIHVSLETREYAFSGRPEARRIETLFGDSAVFDFTPYRGAVDLFFIDGAHSYEYVRSDTQNALTCVRRGGVIAWHDYGRLGVNGVSRLLDELKAKGYSPYVIPGGSLAFMVVP